MDINIESKSGYGKRPLWQWGVIYLLLAIVVYGAVYYFFLRNKSYSYVSNKPTYASTNSNVVSKQKFQDSDMATNSYKIFPGPITDASKQAMSGFKMETKVIANGVTQITLLALESNYKTQQYTVKPGETLYFIDKFAGDDSLEQNSDRSVNDDTAVVVDSQGNIL